MTDVERTLLNHYNLSTLYPTEWPAEKDDDEPLSEDGEERRDQASPLPKNQKRYTTINPQFSRSAARAQAPPLLGSSTQKDEADPLGTTGSVVNALRRRGVGVEEDMELRNKFLLSSTSFNASLYLSEVHGDASTQDLLKGLGYLSQSIEQKSASLKVLVESNFERFVKAKATIDKVYKEMTQHGKEPEHDPHTRPRHSMRLSGSHFRNISGSQLSPSMKSFYASKRKNALTKESEFGVLGIKSPLQDATTKAEELFAPALGGREREEHLKTILASLERNRNLFEIGNAIEESIKRRDYTSLADEYARGSKLAIEAKAIAESSKQTNEELKDSDIYQVVITARVWMEIQARIEDFKRETLRRLTGMHFVRQTTFVNSRSDEYMESISIMLQLGSESNPIWVWLLGRLDHLRNRINNDFDRARIELEIQRRKLASGPKPKPRHLAEHLRAAANDRRREDLSSMDSKPVYEYWEKELSSLNSLLSIRGGLLGEVIEFWDIAQTFIDGTRQKTMIMSQESQAKQHHRLARDNVINLRNGVVKLFSLIQEQLHLLFVEAPVEDVSALFTPAPTTPKTPGSALSPGPRHFAFDPKDVPPPSPRTGEFSEKYAFWPPTSNSWIASVYLSRMNNAIAAAAAEIAGLELAKQDPRLMQTLKSLVNDARERSVTAICAAWLYDSDNCRELEDWSKSTDKKDVTNLPQYFSEFELGVLTHLQKTIYLSETANSSSSADVISPPPQRHIEAVQKAFKHSLYKAFSGMMEHAAKPNLEGNGAEGTGDTWSLSARSGEDAESYSVGVRKLLTMSNFQSLRNEAVPNLISAFESGFTTTISDDAKTARDALLQMYTRVFQSYVRPTYDHLRAVIISGITSSAYAASEASKPTDARPYVYEVLLTLVIVHSEVSGTAPTLTGQILSYLLEQLSTAQMDAFKQRPKYSLGALMQATLDVEFLAQTLDNYQTSKAGEIQSQIYLALDERTDNDARQRLQNGLPEMRAILKRLREKTKGEFSCFRRVRKNRPSKDVDIGSRSVVSAI